MQTGHVPWLLFTALHTFTPREYVQALFPRLLKILLRLSSGQPPPGKRPKMPHKPPANMPPRRRRKPAVAPKPDYIEEMLDELRIRPAFAGARRPA